MVVGACFAPIEQWERLAPDWNRILKDEGVAERNGYRALHMKDLGAGRKAYEGWTPDQRANLLGRLGARAARRRFSGSAR